MIEFCNFFFCRDEDGWKIKCISYGNAEKAIKWCNFFPFCILLGESMFASNIYISKQFKKKLILSCVLAEQAILGSAKTVLKFKYEI